MNPTTIHESGQGPDYLRVISYDSGAAYQATRVRSVFVQGDDAADLREHFEALEDHDPERPCRDTWMTALEPLFDAFDERDQ